MKKILLVCNKVMILLPRYFVR